MESRRTSLPTADELAIAQIGNTALCGHCATLIRFHPGQDEWRHAIIGLDHAPDVRFADRPAQFDPHRPIVSPTDSGISESEARMIDGNR